MFLTEFDNIVQWAVAHEIGHLIIRVVPGKPQLWFDGAHLKATGPVMGSHPGLGGITAVRFHDEEINEISLPNRASVP